MDYLYVYDKEGVITVIDPTTGKLIKKISGAFDIEDQDEAKSNGKNVNLKIDHIIGDKCLSRLSWENNSGKLNTIFSLYDLEKKIIIQKQRLTGMATLPEKSIPFGDDTCLLFYKTTQKLRMPELDLPQLIDPTDTKLKGKKLLKAIKEEDEQQKVILDKYDADLAAFESAENYYTTKVYRDFGCTQELLTVPKASFVFKQNDFLIFWKEASIDVYDFKTLKLLHTIYRI